MALEPVIRDVLRGPLLEGGGWPLNLRVTMCDLRPRFLAKGQAGRGYRAIARNGRVLLASRLPLADWIGRRAHMRLQTWHQRILPDDPPAPYGVLFCLCPVDDGVGSADYECRLMPRDAEPWDLQLDVGGRLALAVRRLTA